MKKHWYYVHKNIIIIIILQLHNGMVSAWKTKKGKTSKFVDAGGYNRIERERNWRLWVGRQRRVEKKDKIITLGTERYENIKTLYANNKLLLLLSSILLLSVLLIGRSIDLWKVTGISSLCSIEKLLFPRMLCFSNNPDFVPDQIHIQYSSSGENQTWDLLVSCQIRWPFGQLSNLIYLQTLKLPLFPGFMVVPFGKTIKFDLL